MFPLSQAYTSSVVDAESIIESSLSIGVVAWFLVADKGRVPNEAVHFRYINLRDQLHEFEELIRTKYQSIFF
jgi:hypothetical protein